MSRGIPGGSILVTPRQARMLYDAANLGALRVRLRGNDGPLYALLVDLSQCAFTVADSGIEPRQSAASEERGMWTVRQLSRETGRAERTIRLDIENNLLPASKTGGSWLIDHTAATTYIASRRNA